jgi:alpha-galactosidase
VYKDGDTEVWARQLKDGSRAVILFNRGGDETQISASWEQLGYPEHLSATVRDLWMKKDLGTFSGTYGVKVPSHGVVMIKVAP